MPDLQVGKSVVSLLQQWENFFGITVLQFVGRLLGSSRVEQMVTSSKRTYVTVCASQVCCGLSPCCHGRSLLTHASRGDTQTRKDRSGPVSCGPFVTPWTAAHQAPLSMEFSRQEYWSGLPFPSSEDLPQPGIEPMSPTLQTVSLSSEWLGKPKHVEKGDEETPK